MLEYDGGCFHGWQKQPGLYTVQGELQRALQIVLRCPLDPPCGASRTDAGVHAKGQVANVIVPLEPKLGALQRSLTGILRGKAAVLKVEQVPEDFNARFSARCKQYTYTILNRPEPAVLDKGRVWHVRAPLNIEVMRTQAALFVGEHDFGAFRAQDCSASSSIRRVLESEIISAPPYVYYRVVGEGFLKQMVRIMVGTLVGLGRSQKGVKLVSELLVCADRRLAGVTAPACGLCLDWVAFSS